VKVLYTVQGIILRANELLNRPSRRFGTVLTI